MELQQKYYKGMMRKEWEKKAAQIIIEHLAESNYNKKTGKEFYDYVMNYISNNSN